MGTALKWLQAIVLKAGVKVPQIWPDILQIMRSVEHILVVIASGANLEGKQLVPVTDAGGQLVEDLATRGVSREEAKRVVAMFEQSDLSVG